MVTDADAPVDSEVEHDEGQGDGGEHDDVVGEETLHDFFHFTYWKHSVQHSILQATVII